MVHGSPAPCQVADSAGLNLLSLIVRYFCSLLRSQLAIIYVACDASMTQKQSSRFATEDWTLQGLTLHVGYVARFRWACCVQCDRILPVLAVLLGSTEGNSWRARHGRSLRGYF